MRQKPDPWAAPQKAGMLDVHFIPIFPCWGRSYELGTFSWTQAVPAFVCSGGGPLILQQATELFCVLSSSQASIICWFLRSTPDQSVRQFYEKPKCRIYILLLSFFPRETCKLDFSSQMSAMLVVSRGWHSWNKIAFLTCFNKIVPAFELPNWFLEFSWRLLDHRQCLCKRTRSGAPCSIILLTGKL